MTSGQPRTSAWVKGLAIKGAAPSGKPSRASPQLWGCRGEGGAEAFGGGDTPGEGLHPRGGVQLGKGAPLGEGMFQRGGACPWGRACCGGTPFSPGLHGARLAGVHIPDVAGWVNKELELGQR